MVRTITFNNWNKGSIHNFNKAFVLSEWITCLKTQIDSQHLKHYLNITIYIQCTLCQTSFNLYQSEIMEKLNIFFKGGQNNFKNWVLKSKLFFLFPSLIFFPTGLMIKCSSNNKSKLIYAGVTTTKCRYMSELSLCLDLKEF